MDSMGLATSLVLNGYVVVPDVLVGTELTEMRDAFERRAGELDKRWLDWDEICKVPDLLGYLLHPNLMPVVESFMGLFGEKPVFANCSGIRDTYDPNRKRKKDFDPSKSFSFLIE